MSVRTTHPGVLSHYRVALLFEDPVVLFFFFVGVSSVDITK